MRYLILSDIHANWEALEAVLHDAAGRYGKMLCCGDLVGYGADPNAVVEWVRHHAAGIVRGNHDKACAGLEDLEWFNPVARTAAQWTMRTLSPGNLQYLRELPKGPLPVDDFQILHGSPLDEDEYLVSGYDAEQLRGYAGTDLNFFGHTHKQGGFLVHRNGVRHIETPGENEDARELAVDRQYLCLINPGSVGQPRDGDARAAYVIYDADENVVEYRRVRYAIAEAQQKIIGAGLPEILAQRLSSGV